jgi:copper homeostasis protein
MNPSHITLEVCIDSVEGAMAAACGGADRLELCSALSEGGITPSYGLVQQVQEASDLPVMMMIRCRSGSFVYSERELEVMLRDVEVAKSLGVHGVVFGALTKIDEVDLETNRQIVDAARPLEITFHRAFDERRVDAASSLQCLHTLGVDRLLTSGQQATARDGMQLIADLVARRVGEISIMPGAGVRTENAALIIQATQAHEIHGTFSRFSETLQRRVTCEATVREIRTALDRIA